VEKNQFEMPARSGDSENVTCSLVERSYDTLSIT